MLIAWIATWEAVLEHNILEEPLLRYDLITRDPRDDLPGVLLK